MYSLKRGNIIVILVIIVQYILGLIFTNFRLFPLLQLLSQYRYQYIIKFVVPFAFLVINVFQSIFNSRLLIGGRYYFQYVFYFFLFLCYLIYLFYSQGYNYLIPKVRFNVGLSKGAQFVNYIYIDIYIILSNYLIQSGLANPFFLFLYQNL